MAVITKKPVAKVGSKQVSVVDMISGAQVVMSDGIDFVQRAGGGREASAESQALRNKANALKIGQGFLVPKSLVVEREVKNSKTGATSTIYTYKGANLIGKIEGKKFRTRRDVNGNMYIFRTTPVPEVEAAEE